ncbi:hypothetical protein AB0J83_32510 [Actinoplanes sp. NPDC049596]|uniref:hypothetical protein n=1 Tax=unclassified Actinoplanes TaxID=2626549 RepID=UPI00343D03EC
MMLLLGLKERPGFGIRGENHWFMPDVDGGEGVLYVSFASLDNPVARFHTAERMLDRLEQRRPGFRENIAFAEVSTPLSFENYQHSVRGSFYGPAATPERLRAGFAGTRTAVKGLVVAGQDAWGSGVVGSPAGGLMAAGAVPRPRRFSRGSEAWERR